jgi:ketosteroid isomerase-like protein
VCHGLAQCQYDRIVPPADDSDPDIALVVDAYRAYARGDIDQAVTGLHPEVEWIEPDEFPNGGRRQGPAAVVDYLRASRAMWTELVSEATPHRRGDDIVIVHHVFGRMVDGSHHDVTVADVFTVRQGQVVRMRAYADPAEALADLG